MRLFFTQALVQSFLLHVVLLLFGTLMFFQTWFDWTGFNQKKLVNEKIEITVYDAPKLVTPKVVDLAKPQPKLNEKPKVDTATPHQVFGISKKALLADSQDSKDSDSIGVKTGNTIAKAPDLETLGKSDEEALPIPVEEYLVTAMPKLQKEVHIPYPVEAQKLSLEGPVVMDLLIDEQGKVKNVQLISGPGHGLNEAALNAMVAFEFSPARVREKAVAVRIRYTYRFVLELK